jgi:hypothetical protein
MSSEGREASGGLVSVILRGRRASHRPADRSAGPRRILLPRFFVLRGGVAWLVLRWGPGARRQAREGPRSSSDGRSCSRHRGDLRIVAGSKGLVKGPARDRWRPRWRGVTPFGVWRRVVRWQRFLWGRGAVSRRPDDGAPRSAGAGRQLEVGVFGARPTARGRQASPRRSRAGWSQSSRLFGAKGLVTVGGRLPSGLRCASKTSGPTLRGQGEGIGALTGSRLLMRAEGAG